MPPIVTETLDGPVEQAMRSLVDLIQSTGLFGTTAISLSGDRARTTIASYPAAIVMPLSWHESNATLTGTRVRQVQFAITLIVRHASPAARLLELDQLSQAVVQVVANASVGSGCLPLATRLGHGRYEPAIHAPAGAITLSGEFCCLAG